jgi:hypothetical protein
MASALQDGMLQYGMLLHLTAYSDRVTGVDSRDLPYSTAFRTVLAWLAVAANGES